MWTIIGSIRRSPIHGVIVKLFPRIYITHSMVKRCFFTCGMNMSQTCFFFWWSEGYNLGCAGARLHHYLHVRSDGCGDNPRGHAGTPWRPWNHGAVPKSGPPGMMYPQWSRLRWKVLRWVLWDFYGMFMVFLWDFYGLFIFHRIGWWDNLQKNPIFDGKNHGFRLRFSLKPIQWIFLQRFIRMFKPLGILPLFLFFFAVFFSLYLAVGIEKNLSI